MAKNNKWYVVWQGREPGVYDSWSECQAQIQGYAGAKYKSFPTQTAALRAYEDGYEQYRQQQGTLPSEDKPILRALSVDAACSGNPGVMEYRGVLVETKREVFRVGPFPKGTNNIGEFLALVHGISLLHKHKVSMPIYSDSVTGISWVRNKRCKTLLPRDSETEALLDLVARAEAWLRDNPHEADIRKWNTEAWGEIPADFGRK